MLGVGGWVGVCVGGRWVGRCVCVVSVGGWVWVGGFGWVWCLWVVHGWVRE